MSRRCHATLSAVFCASLLALFGCGGGGSSTGGGNLPVKSIAPTVAFNGWAPNDAALLQYQVYTFSASATDPNLGGSITQFQWNFGDGTTQVTPVVLSGGKATTTASYSYVTSGTPTLSVVAQDAAGLSSTPATQALTVTAAPSPLTVTFTTPTTATPVNTAVGSSVQVTFAVQVVNTGTGTVSASGVTLSPGDATATVGTPTDMGGGLWNIVVTYPGAATPGSRDATPTVQIKDSNGITSSVVTGPVITIKTVSGVDSAPVITLVATPALVAGTNATWQNVPIAFVATATDPDGDTLTYSWTFGDGGSGDVTATQNVSALSQSHTYKTAGVYPVTFTADDGRGVAGVSVKSITLNLNILANGAPTLTIAQAPASPTYANVPITFTATVGDPNGDVVTLTWNFGDGSAPVVGTNPVTHSFAATGSTTVQATADDGKGGVTVVSTTLNVLQNRPPVCQITTAAANLYQNKSYTFTATATDPDVGDTVTQYQWNFGDGSGIQTSASGTLNHTYASSFTGNASVSVCAVDNHGSTGNFSPAVVFPVLATPLPVVTFTSPAATSLNVDLSPATVTQVFTLTATNPRAGTTGVTDPIPVGNITFLPNDPAATVTSAVSTGGGSYSFTVKYTGAAAAGTRTSAPTAYATDSLGIVGLASTGPVMTLNTLGVNHAPTITLTTPATDNTVAWTSKPFSLGFTLTDQDNDPVTYTVDWGDGQPVSTGTTTTATTTGVAETLTHTYLDAFTAATKGVSIKVTATDNRSANNQAVAQTRLVTVTYNAPPTATITTPQASGTAPTGLQGGVNPPYVVVPLQGQLAFAGTSTLPGSQDPLASQVWTFPSGTPSTLTGDTPSGNVMFAGTQGVITPVTVTYTVTDAFGRTASATKQVLVDGKNTQLFNLSFQYRLKSDNNTTTSLTTVTTQGNGLGAPVQIYQDGLSNTYNVQNQAQLAGAQAAVQIPVRSDLPFYIEIPGFGNDNTTYLMRIPNAPTGAYADSSLAVAPPAGSSNFSFSSVTAPWGPTLQIVTAQGFAAESNLPPQRMLAGYTDIIIGASPNPANNRWLNRLSVPSSDPLAVQWPQSNNSVGLANGITAYQLFAEWPTLLLTRKTGDLAETVPDATSGAGISTDLGFVMNYPTYVLSTPGSQTYAAFSMQAFRVPAGVTDPYQLSPAWQSAGAEMNSTFVNPHAGLNPVPVGAGVPIFFDHLVSAAPGATPLAGGISSLTLPYDPNDPNRTPLAAPTTRGYSGIAQLFSYSEYLWSTVWAQPLVLNSARPSLAATLSTFPYFRYSTPAAWPKASGISPDNSAFDLTVHGGGVFDGSAPVGLNGAAAPTTGVGHFYWTAYTPSYQGDANSGAAIARTWLADDSTQQPPNTFAGSATGDATVALGFMTPQDTIVDKRGRNADGSLSGSTLGGYRVTWFNPTKDAGGNPVAPDFWVVELKDGSGTKHFMLPASYPAATQSVTDLIMTDARTYLPSGTTPGAGATVAPGYCWFDIPLELRPSGAATLTVFAVKSILKNHPVAAARVLNRPDWVDAAKTASATMKMLTTVGTPPDLTYAYKIPFNFDWDIVVVNGPMTPVAP